MDSTYRQLLRHAGIFGAGAILFRLASIILLPLYTRYLQPADYGVMALLDLTINLISIVAGAGIASAATRAHFTDSDNVNHDCVWWTAILSEMVLATLIVLPAFLLRGSLAVAVFGPEIGGRGAYYLALALASLWVASVTTVVDSYFRAQKASSFVVGVGLVRLVINIILNVTFVVGWRMGVAGVLWGNLISAVISAMIQGVPFIAVRKRVVFDWRVALGYWRFGWPLIVYGLCSATMHESDRFVLRLFVSLHEVGLYSVAYQIGQGVNTLIVMPFSAIWSVLIYEIARQPDAKATYAKVFKQYVFGLSVVFLFAALFARPILALIAPPEYGRAAEIVPVVCLAYFFFSIHDHFKIPALLASRTVALLPAVMIAAIANLALNFLMIPRFGAFGAAWASVLTFALFATIGLVRNRRIDRYPYPFAACAAVVAGTWATYAVHHAIAGLISAPVSLVLAAAVWIVWAAALFGKRILRRENAAVLYSLFSKSGKPAVSASTRLASSPPEPQPDDVDGSPVVAGLNER